MRKFEAIILSVITTILAYRNAKAAVLAPRPVTLNVLTVY
jgi:hypothetical protein